MLYDLHLKYNIAKNIFTCTTVVKLTDWAQNINIKLRDYLSNPQTKRYTCLYMLDATLYSYVYVNKDKIKHVQKYLYRLEWKDQAFKKDQYFQTFHWVAWGHYHKYGLPVYFIKPSVPNVWRRQFLWMEHFYIGHKFNIFIFNFLDLSDYY